MPQLPPCWQRDEWTRDPNGRGPNAKTQAKTPEQQAEDTDARFRAQLTCLTICDQRQACLERAMATPVEDDHFIWGGYTSRERRQMRAGTLTYPHYVGHPHYSLIHQLLSGRSTAAVADDMATSAKSVRNMVSGDIWAMRKFQMDDLTGFCTTETSESSETVHAA